MSLATQCTSCSTVFRVVQDQLKVSEGWVRCGRCDAVFNALEGLFDLGREAPADWEQTRRPGEVADISDGLEAVAPGRQSSDIADEGGTPSALDELLADPVDAHLFGRRKRTESAPKPAGQIGARDRVEFSDARFDSDLFAENVSSADAEISGSSTTDVAALESASRPEFLRRAERRARWRSTPARVALALACALSLLALLLQLGHHYRNSLVSQWPPLQPLFATWCSLARCTLEAPRHLEDVLVESSALTRAPGIDGFVLAVTLRNRSAVTVALPSVDLKLTDGNERLVARRALAPSDFRAGNILQAGGESALQLTLATGAVPVAGYSVEIFYP